MNELKRYSEVIDKYEKAIKFESIKMKMHKT